MKSANALKDASKGLIFKPGSLSAASPVSRHDVYMFGLGWRIAWLEAGHTHWWLRQVREHHTVCSWCRRCDPGAAA